METTENTENTELSGATGESTNNTESSQEETKWFDTLGDTLKGNEALSEYDSIDSFVESSLKDREELNTLRDSVPVIPEKYEFETEGLDQDAVAQFEGKAKELGLSQEQAAGVVAFNKARFESIQQEMVQNEVKALDGIKAEWGVNYDKNLKDAMKAVEVFGGDDFKQFLNETRLGNNPAMMKLFQNIGAKLSEDSFHTDTTGHAESGPRLDATGAKKLDFSKSMNKT